MPTDATANPPTDELLASADRLAGGVFFIVGAPRSGTTLVQAMLSSHPSLAVPPEGEFFMRCRAQEGEEATRRVLEAYFDSEKFREQGIDAGETMRRCELICRRERGVGGGDVRLAAFVAMLTIHAQRTGRSRIGEKSPHHCRHVEEIAGVLPAARFIHVVRDPRDVVASRLAVPWTRASHLSLARSWVKDVERHFRLVERMSPGVYLQLRLEDLVASPEGELRRLCSFLGEPFDGAMLRFHERDDPGFSERERGWKGGTLKPLDPSSIGRYRERLSARQIGGIQRIARDQLCRLGYPTDGVGWGPLRPVADAFDRGRDTFRKLGKSIGKRVP